MSGVPTSACTGRSQRVAALALVALAALVSGAVVPAGPAQAATRVSTRTLLRQLSVDGEHEAGYRRSAFSLWTDADHDGCDTRQEVLIVEAVERPSRGSRCTLTGGTWVSRYDGATYDVPRALDIDHLVPLAEAWRSGAATWTAATRTAYANDLGYADALVAVSASANRAKGDREPQDWLPQRDVCWYVASWVTVKWRWHLEVDAAERSFLAARLSACGWPVVSKPTRPAIGVTPH